MCDISIIIPIFNAQAYLDECIQSVLKQDICQKEIICIDDGSTDTSVSIIKKYMENFPEIKLFSQTNQGAGVARNNGINHASGRYIAFMDADDFYMDTTALRIMVEECEKKQMKICGSYLSTMKKGEICVVDTYKESFTQNEECICLSYRDYQFDLNYQCYIFNRDFLNDYNLRFPDYRRYQDPPFFVKAMYYAENFCVIPTYLYCYRLRDTKFRFSFLQINDALKGIKENLEFAYEKNLEILYETTKERLDKDLYYALVETLEQGNIKALEQLLELENIIKADENLRSNECKLEIIKWIRLVLHDNRKIGNWEYQFPYEDIPYGSRIALYGAGMVGKTMYYILQNTQYAEVVVWVDSQYQNYQKEGLNVFSKEMLIKEEFDYLLIAVEKQSLFEEIKREIETLGIHKQIVGPISKKMWR